MAILRSEMYLWPLDTLYVTNYVVVWLKFYLRTHLYIILTYAKNQDLCFG